MTTEQTTDETTEEIPGEASEIDGDYERPAIAIRKVTMIGDYNETVTVDFRDVQDYPSTGDLVVVLETALRALAGEKKTDETRTMELTVQPMPPAMAGRFAEAIKRASVVVRPGRSETPVGAEAIEEELHRVEQHDQGCYQDHTAWLNHLRDLILQARADKATADAAASGRPTCRLCGSQGPAMTSALDASCTGVQGSRFGVYKDLEPDAIVCSNREACRKRRLLKPDPIPGGSPDDLGDAVQGDAATADTSEGGL